MAVRGIRAGQAKTEIGDLYELWTLDAIPSLGQHCGRLFQEHPQQFKNVPADITSVLAVLRFRTGYDETFLADDQRRGVATPFLGDSDGRAQPDTNDAFHRASIALQNRAVDFVQRVYDTGEAQLRDAFRDAAITLQQYLTILDGSVLTDAVTHIQGHFSAVVSVLQATEFASGLGLPAAAASPWPLDLSADGDGAFLVSAILSRSVGSSERLTDQAFLCIQRVSAYGSATLDRVLLDPSILTSDASTDETISLAYRWWTAMSERRLL